MTSEVLAFIDQWWGILLPVILGMIFRKEIMDFWKYVKMRASKKPYSHTGNFVKFDADGPWWKIHDMNKNVVELYRINKETRKPDGLGLKMTMGDFIHTRLYFEADI